MRCIAHGHGNFFLAADTYTNDPDIKKSCGFETYKAWFDNNQEWINELFIKGKYPSKDEKKKLDKFMSDLPQDSTNILIQTKFQREAFYEKFAVHGIATVI